MSSRRRASTGSGGLRAPSSRKGPASTSMRYETSPRTTHEASNIQKNVENLLFSKQGIKSTSSVGKSIEENRLRAIQQISGLAFRDSKLMI